MRLNQYGIYLRAVGLKDKNISFSQNIEWAPLTKKYYRFDIYLNGKALMSFLWERLNKYLLFRFSEDKFNSLLRTEIDDENDIRLPVLELILKNFQHNSDDVIIQVKRIRDKIRNQKPRKKYYRKLFKGIRNYAAQTFNKG